MLESISWGRMDSGITSVSQWPLFSTFCPPCSLRSDFTLWDLRGNLTLLCGVLWTRWRQVRNCHLQPRLLFPPGDPFPVLSSLPALLPRPHFSQISVGCMPNYLFQKLCKIVLSVRRVVLVLPGGRRGRQIRSDLTLLGCCTWISGKVACCRVLKTPEPRELSELLSQVFEKE